jgi:hypothetical protein
VDVIVGVDDTSFQLSGPPDAVSRQLVDLCAALAEPPLVRVDALIDAVGVHRLTLPDTTGSLLLHRYGPSGPGLARWPGPRHETLAVQTKSWARRALVDGLCAEEYGHRTGPDSCTRLADLPSPPSWSPGF